MCQYLSMCTFPTVIIKKVDWTQNADHLAPIYERIHFILKLLINSKPCVYTLGK